MCGRVKLLTQEETDVLKENLVQIGVQLRLPNIDVHAVTEVKEARVGGSLPYFAQQKAQNVLDPMQAHWGFRAPWTKQLIFNTRLESSEKDFWKQNFKDGRCLVMCKSFFEPSNDYYITADGKRNKRQYEYSNFDGSPLFLAAISDGQDISIVTRAAKDKDAKIHDRLALALKDTDIVAWLNGEINAEKPSEYLELKNESDRPTQEQLAFF